MNLPKECSKSEFARMVGVDPANVSRWASAKRLELNPKGRVIVLPSLTRLLATLDPSRGGRTGQRGPGDGGTIDTCRRLLEQAGTQAAAASSSDVVKLKAQLAEVTEQLEVERKFRQTRCVLDDDLAKMIGSEWAEIERAWDALAAARVAGGDAFDRLSDRIVGRVFYGRTEEELDEQERDVYGS